MPALQNRAQDYGWRFHLGPVGGSPPSPAPPGPPAPKPGCEDLKKAFPVDAGGYEFMGLTHGSGNSAQACATTCCDMGKGCYMWQFSSGPGGGCWVGSGTRGNKNGNWTGGARAGPAPPPSPKPTPHPGDGPDVLPASSPAAVPSFDDSSWQLIDLPHDYIVEGAYDQNVPGDQGPGSSPGGAGQSYLPRYLGFYRKHFTLPSDWKGKVIWIYFEGVFRSAKFWFNGQAVREHSPFAGDAHGEGGGVGMGGGYTSFSVRLDNATTVHYGTDQENVLSVYVDPRMGSGWFYGACLEQLFLSTSVPLCLLDTQLTPQ